MEAMYSEVQAGFVFRDAAQNCWVKHHPNGLLVHPATQTDNLWSAQPTLEISSLQPEEKVDVIGRLDFERR